MLTSSVVNTSPVSAANYGGFGSTYSEVISPKDAVYNEETINSDTVKAGKAELSKLLSVVASIKDDLVILLVLTNAWWILTIILWIKGKR